VTCAEQGQHIRARGSPPTCGPVTGRENAERGADVGVGAELAGTVMNRIDPDEGYYGYYYAGYRYGTDADHDRTDAERSQV
jgi:hypothetical protein